MIVMALKLTERKRERRTKWEESVKKTKKQIEGRRKQEADKGEREKRECE